MSDLKHHKSCVLNRLPNTICDCSAELWQPEIERLEKKIENLTNHARELRSWMIDQALEDKE